MAWMCPETISSDSNVTPGEKRVFLVLRDALLPHEEYLVWYEPQVGNREADFIVWGQDIGLLVIEVKDWEARHISDINPKQWTHNGKIKKSPFEQAKEAKNELIGKIKGIKDFTEKGGQYADKIKFPVNHLVIFTAFNKEEADRLGFTKAFGEDNPLFSDDLLRDFDSIEKRNFFKSKLKERCQIKFHFNPLNTDEIKILRSVLFPEVHISQVRRKLRKEDDDEQIKVLDFLQEQVAKDIGEGHRILKGVAGSGKTLVLAHRAKWLHLCYPKWKILVVCYNISLSRYLEQLIAAAGPGPLKSDKAIDILHFHKLARILIGDGYPKGTGTREFDQLVGNALLKAIEDGKVKKGIYDAILIDEGQDFLTEWMQGLTQLLNPETDSLLFCYDPAQNVFCRSRPNWKTAGFKVQGKRPTELKTGYRNTVEILETAIKFSKVDMQINKDADDSLQRPLFPISTNRHGDKPRVSCCNDDKGLFDYILKEIRLCLETADCNYSDIAILYADKYFRYFPPEKFYKAFCLEFGEDKISYVTKTQQHKNQLNLLENTVKLITIHSAKGLEFKVVFLIGLEAMPRHERQEEEDRSLTYTGITRAEDILYVPYISCTGLAKEIKEIVDTLPEQAEKKK